MNTPAHLLMGAAIAARPGDRARNIGAVLGALAPDALIFFMVFWEGVVRGQSARYIFGVAYNEPFWHIQFAISNSIPLYAALALAGWALARGGLFAFGLAASAHCLMDWPLHHDDGHPHFWPFSDWIYQSPVSYWDVNHHGALVGALELALCAALALWLWLRFRPGPGGGWTPRILIMLCLAAQFTPAIIFGLMFAGG